MGEVFASQFYCTIAEKVLHSDPNQTDFSGKKAVGTFLKEKVYKPGLRYPWNEMIERATGEKLTAKFYARQLEN
jgi:peptidyl-dipeptidase A